MQDFAKSFYKSQAWKQCRASYAKAHHYLCERCLERGIYCAGEIVHHIKHLTPENIADPETTLNWDNLMLVCRDCHGELHQHERRYGVAADGRVIL